MRVAVRDGRTALVVGDRAVDVEAASGGSVPADPAAMFRSWDALRDLAGHLGAEDASEAPTADPTTLQRPVPPPLQVFGIGLNYADHAGESAMDLPDVPLVFPKFPTSVVGPDEPVATGSAALDWEAELVVVIGTDCYGVPRDEALSVIAGYTVGQDLSDRVVQFENGANPQFGLGKSAPGYGPIGPWVVSADELGTAHHLGICCSVDGEVKQSSTTGSLIFDVPALVEHLSARVALRAGDLIFTGTPSGIGWAREPKETLHPGSIIESTIDGIGTLTTRIVAR